MPSRSPMASISCRVNVSMASTIGCNDSASLRAPSRVKPTTGSTSTRPTRPVRRSADCGATGMKCRSASSVVSLSGVAMAPSRGRLLEQCRGVGALVLDGPGISADEDVEAPGGVVLELEGLGDLFGDGAFDGGQLRERVVDAHLTRREREPDFVFADLRADLDAVRRDVARVRRVREVGSRRDLQVRGLEDDHAIIARAEEAERGAVVLVRRD